MAITTIAEMRVERADPDVHWHFSSAFGDPSLEMLVVVEDNPLTEEFVCFCLERRGYRWPELYDEMCRVASHRLFRGMGYTELQDQGVSLSLANMNKLAALAETLASSPNRLQVS